jgi:hypothetical protein
MSAAPAELENLGREGLRFLLQRYGTPEITGNDLAMARYRDAQTARDRAFDTYQAASEALAPLFERRVTLLRRGRALPASFALALARAVAKRDAAWRAYERARRRDDAAFHAAYPPEAIA